MAFYERALYYNTITRHLFLFYPSNRVLRTKHQIDNNLTHVEHRAHNNQCSPYHFVYSICMMPRKLMQHHNNQPKPCS